MNETSQGNHRGSSGEQMKLKKHARSSQGNYKEYEMQAKDRSIKEGQEEWWIRRFDLLSRSVSHREREKRIRQRDQYGIDET